jgi:regulator of protease activity HflC (stomatin/prohibitin superfamily)
LAALAAPYRHARLSAVKHIEHADTIDGISANATPEELRAEIAKRVVLLRDKGYVDLEALPPPANGEVAIADAEGDEEDQQEGSD